MGSAPCRAGQSRILELQALLEYLPHPPNRGSQLLTQKRYLYQDRLATTLWQTDLLVTCHTKCGTCQAAKVGAYRKRSWFAAKRRVAEVDLKSSAAKYTLGPDWFLAIISDSRDLELAPGNCWLRVVSLPFIQGIRDLDPTVHPCRADQSEISDRELSSDFGFQCSLGKAGGVKIYARRRARLDLCLPERSRFWVISPID